MPLFSGKHYSNPAVGRSHETSFNEKGLAYESAGGMGHEEKAHHSMHATFHDDGTAHTHIHHVDGDHHEHTDHATHEEAHEHLKAAMDGQTPEQEEQGGEVGEKEEKMPMHSAVRASGGAF